MRKKLWAMGVVAGLLAGKILMAQTPVDAQKCDELYAKRGVALFEASHCYLSLKQYDRVMIALSAVVTASPKTPDERRAIDFAFEVLEGMKPALETTGVYKYWYAVWVSFDAIAQDRGALIPRRMFGNLKFIQTQLRHAIDLDPSTHFYGPHRVLGMMHTQMPGIVGGDKRLAENALKIAYENAPMFSANAYGYANILYLNGKSSEAKQVLVKFLALSDKEINPYPGQPLRALVPESEADRVKAKELLAELNADGS